MVSSEITYKYFTGYFMTPQELIQKSSIIDIALPTHPSQEERRIASVLYCALKNIEKQVSFDAHSPTVSPSKNSSEKQEKTFAVSITGLAPWISQVYYEKDATDLKIYFTLKGREAQNTTPSPAADRLTIAVQDTAPQVNKQHISRKNGSSTIYATTPVRDFAVILLSQSSGAEKKLLGRILTNLEYINSLGIYLSIITESNFTASGASTKALHFAIEELKAAFGETHSFLLLFGSSQASTGGLLWSPRQDVQDKIMLYGNGEGKGNWVLFSTNRKDPHTVKQDILNELEA